MQGTSYLIVLIFECAQNIEIGMNRYTASVSQIAGIARFIRVKNIGLGIGVGKLPSGEVNNFSRYIVESLHKAWGLLNKYHWAEEIFSLKKYIWLFISLQVLVLFHHCDVLIVETGLHITHTLNLALNWQLEIFP